MKTLEEFNFTQSPNVTATKMRDLSEGGYIERAEPVLTHLMTGLCVAACWQKRRVRFTTAAGLVNEVAAMRVGLLLLTAARRGLNDYGHIVSRNQNAIVRNRTQYISARNAERDLSRGSNGLSINWRLLFWLKTN